MATIDPKTGLPITDVSNAAIPTSALSTPQTPIKVASVADQTPIYNAGITTGTGQTQQALDLAQKQADELAAQNKYVEGSNTLSALQAQVAGKAADQASAYAQTGGVNDLYKQLSQLNVEAQGLNRQTLANPLQQQEAAIGTGRTQGQVDQITAQNQRQIALKALDLGQRAAIAQGNYDVAKNLADQQIEAKYAGITAQIEAQKTNLAALDKIVLTPAQEKRKEAQSALLKKQEQDLADKKANDKAINDMLIEASQVAPADVLAKAKDIQAKGGTSVQVASALGKYGGDYLKNELLKEQLKTEKAQQANYYANAAKTSAEAKASGLPGTFKALTEGQAKDLTYAQRADQSESQINRLESTISKMSGAEYLKQKALESNSLTSASASSEIKQYRQAQRNFITAILRRESGASISPSEFDTAEKQYFPQPGDDTQTLLQKKNARNTAVNSFKQNVPNYSERTATTEDNYLDKFALPAVTKVSEKVDNPISSYRMRLTGLPGTK